MKLTDAERELLAACFVRSTRNPEHLAFLAEPAVEHIGAARVTAAFNEAAETDGWIALEADKHHRDEKRGGCTCGFCAWSPEHVAVMSFRDGFPRHAARIVRAAIPTDSAIAGAP